GITSFGDQYCQQNGGATRVDAYWDSFIAPAILAADGTLPVIAGSPDAGTGVDQDGGTPGPGSNLPVGQACTDSNQCASAICTLGSKRYCTASCDPKNESSC